MQLSYFGKIQFINQLEKKNGLLSVVIQHTKCESLHGYKISKQSKFTDNNEDTWRSKMQTDKTILKHKNF